MTVFSTRKPLVEIWRRIVGPGKVWGVFEHGTCVVFSDRNVDVLQSAVSVLREWGPVRVGSSAGNFSVVDLEHEPGWVVTSHHPGVLTYVSPAEREQDAAELGVGLVGRALRDRDATELNIVYVEGEGVGAPIRFYSKRAENQELANFAPFGFEEEGLFFPTVEHYFQAQKFLGPENAAYREAIRRARSPRAAKALGRTRTIAIRSDWDTVRDQVMLDALRKKFAAPRLRALLLETGLRQLVEASPTDSYWGCGRSGRGKNRLGQLLMQVRAELRSEREPRPRA